MISVAHKILHLGTTTGLGPAGNVGNTHGNKLDKLNGHVVPSKGKIQSIFVLSTNTKRSLKALEKRQRTV